MQSAALRILAGLAGAVMLFLGARHIATEVPVKLSWLFLAAAGLVGCVVSLWLRRKQEENARKN